MSISLSNMYQIMASGVPILRDIIDTEFGVFKRPIRPNPEFMELYRHELARALTARDHQNAAGLWKKWLEKQKPYLRERLEKLNPKGISPGERPRGYNRKWCKTDVWMRDLVTVDQYIMVWNYWPDSVIRKGRQTFVKREHFLKGSAHKSVTLHTWETL